MCIVCLYILAQVFDRLRRPSGWTSDSTTDEDDTVMTILSDQSAVCYDFHPLLSIT